MESDLCVWYAAAAGQTVQLPHVAVCRDGSPLTVLDLRASGALAQPSLSWLLPDRPDAFRSADQRAAYRLLYQATAALALRRDMENVPELLLAANELISWGGRAGDGTALTAGCRRASAAMRRGGCGPVVLARTGGWLAQARPSLLDQTIRKFFRAAAVPVGRRVSGNGARPTTVLGPSARPCRRVSAKLDHLNSAMERACGDREPAWLVLESRYAAWALAGAAAHAAAMLQIESPQAGPRVHRALFGPEPELAASTVIKQLLTWSAVGDVRHTRESGRPLAIGDVAVVELASQLVAYSRRFLDGNDPFEVLGEAVR